MRLLIVSASLSQKGRTAHVLDLVAAAFQRALPGATTELLDLPRAGVEIADGRQPELMSAATQSALEAARRANSFLFGSPMYRGGITGALKNYLDLLPPESMRGKAAAVVATGASHHHYLGVSLTLMPALQFFQMQVVGSHLYVSNSDSDSDLLEARAGELGAALAKLTTAVAAGSLGLGPAIQ